MRNFYDQPTSKIFDRMFGKGARQLQADPTLDLTKCKCCQCDKVECKSCMEGHVIGPTAGCCHTKNQGLIFEYERPDYLGGGQECCRVPPTAPPGSPPFVRRCCGTGKEGAGNVRFYYNYIGQYFNIDFSSTGRYSKWPENGMPRLCSWCDPTSLNVSNPEQPGIGTETCLDFVVEGVPPVDRRIDDGWDGSQSSQSGTVYPCTGYDGLGLFQGCKCQGYGDLKDPAPNFGGNPGVDIFSMKRLSRYRKRQMEQNPQYRWLLDIMCYDQGNVVATPYYEYVPVQGTPENDDARGQVIAQIWGGTLYNHLIGVVHCEHWYEIARCDDNPEHGDPEGVLGGWIRDTKGNVVGANTSNIAPRFWIYACSGVPIFDFEIERARNTFDEFGQPFINPDDYEHLIGQLALKKTPRQEVMLKLAKAGCFDIGDWRQEALNEITTLQGLSYTADYYGSIQGYSGDEGACCFGASGDMNSSCVFMSGVSCGLCGGDFFLGKRCTSDLCVNCSGFKPHSSPKPLSKYLGPVRKKLYVPFNPAAGQDGINYVDPRTGIGVTRPAFLDPRKARPNRWPEDASTFEQIPSSARGKERNFNTVGGEDLTLVDLQLPPDLLPMPWGDFTDPDFFRNGGTLPTPPLVGQAPSEEYKQFQTWLDSQWLYLHAKPGGWDYVCSGYQGDGTEGNPLIQQPRIPNLPRKYSIGCPGVGCCLDGVKGWPQRTFEYDGGCPNIQCRYLDADGNEVNAPTVGCEYTSSCLGIDCIDDSWCADHPDQGGGDAPCRSLAFSSSCEGMRFTYYRHRQVLGDGVNPNDYTTCNGSVKSWLYRVNIDAGNYGGFCPHTCRNLSIPKRIVDSLPTVYTNRLAAHSLCNQYLQDDFRGDMCPGLYCLNNPVVQFQGGIPVPPYYGVAFGGQSHCCGGKRQSEPVNGPIPTDSTHPASNRANCPLYPGPGCFTPTCRFYDGRFVGQYINLNPIGICWQCERVGDQIFPDIYRDIRDLFECEQLQPNDVREFDNFASVGRGFIPFDQIGSASAGGQEWAGNCACGTSNPPTYLPPLVSGEYCEPPDLGNDDVPTGDDNY